MKAIPGIICFGLVLGAHGAMAAEFSIREYEDRIVVEYEGSNDQKPMTPASASAEKSLNPVQERALQKGEERRGRSKARIEAAERQIAKQKEQQRQLEQKQ